MICASGLSALTCTFRALRLLPRTAAVLRRNYSVEESLSFPQADNEDKVYTEKIRNIVADISELNLLEVADLNQLLRKTLKIPDAPMMPMGMMAAPAAKEEEEEVETTRVQTSFTLKITSFDQTKKVTLIKYIKTIMEGMNLVQSKKFVEALPAAVLTNASKDEVDKISEALKEVGAECVIE